MRLPAACRNAGRSTVAARSCRRARAAGEPEIERARDDVVLRDLGVTQLAQDTPLVNDRDAVAATDQLVIVRAVEQDCSAPVGELAQQLIDLLLGSDIDPARRIVEQ